MKAKFEVHVKPGRNARLTWQEISEKIEEETERLEDVGYTVDPQSFKVNFLDFSGEHHYAIEYSASRE